MTLCALSLGCNVGGRLDNLRRAAVMLSRLGDVTKKSAVYETPPWGVEFQPRFLNACVLLETELGPHSLLEGVKEMEQALGRTNRGRWGPREIDIDILTYGEGMINSAKLTAPHPMMRERAFVLFPLSEIARELRLPPDGESVSSLALKAGAEGIVRVTFL